MRSMFHAQDVGVDFASRRHFSVPPPVPPRRIFLLREDRKSRYMRSSIFSDPEGRRPSRTARTIWPFDAAQGQPVDGTGFGRTDCGEPRDPGVPGGKRTPLALFDISDNMLGISR